MRGLDLFKKQFADLSDNYILIGGAACTLAMEEAGLEFRATKDLDIVLSIEVLKKDFLETFWEFIRMGNYQYRQQSSGKKMLYRFYAPQNSSYPQMLELFSRKPDVITLPEGVHLTPIPVDEEISSLSAILLNDDYYRFIQEGKRDIEGISVLASTHLIPLKAQAWINLSRERELGNHVDEKDIRKHRNDVIRLYRLLSPDTKIFLPISIHQDMQLFLEGIEGNVVDLKSLGIKSSNLDEVIAVLRQAYSNFA